MINITNNWLLGLIIWHEATNPYEDEEKEIEQEEDEEG